MDITSVSVSEESLCGSRFVQAGVSLIQNSPARRFLDDSGTRSCVMSVLNNYLSDYYALHTAFSLHLNLLGLLPLLLHP